MYLVVRNNYSLGFPKDHKLHKLCPVALTSGTHLNSSCILLYNTQYLLNYIYFHPRITLNCIFVYKDSAISGYFLELDEDIDLIYCEDIDILLEISHTTSTWIFTCLGHIPCI